MAQNVQNFRHFSKHEIIALDFIVVSVKNTEKNWKLDESSKQDEKEAISKIALELQPCLDRR